MERDGGIFEAAGPWWKSRVVIAVLAAFAGPILLLLSSGPATVTIIYAALFVEGDVIAYVVLQKAHFTRADKIVRTGSEPKRGDKMFLSKERLEELASCLKRAETGSEDSRRQVARDLAPLVGQLDLVSASSSGRLSKALQTVLYPYLDDRALRTEMGAVYAEEARGSGARPGAGRRDYVAGLEVILSELEREGPT